MRQKNSNWLTRSRKRILLIAVATGAIFFIAVPAAQAANIYYASGTYAAEGVPLQSGLRSSMSGGAVYTYIGGGFQEVRTYRPNPGYTLIGNAFGNPFNWTKMYHDTAYTVHSQCYWYWNGVGGSTPMDCYFVT